MSDGNFNRQLLPHTPYASGMKVGQRLTKMRAVETFRESLDRLFHSMTEEEKRMETERFEHELSCKIGNQ